MENGLIDKFGGGVGLEPGPGSVGGWPMGIAESGNNVPVFGYLAREEAAEPSSWVYLDPVNLCLFPGTPRLLSVGRQTLPLRDLRLTPVA